MNNINVAPMWQILFPMTNQLMDILEAPRTRSVSYGHKGMEITTYAANSSNTQGYMEELRSLVRPAAKQVKLPPEVPYGSNEIAFKPQTKQGKVIARLFASNGNKPMSFNELAARVGICDNTLRYHLKKHEGLLKIVDGYVVIVSQSPVVNSQ